MPPSSGFEFRPHHVTVNLAPADLRKAGSAFVSTSTPHGGNELTIQSITTVMAHHGMILVPPGYTDPIMFKAAAGGGGKGMRLVRVGADSPPETHLRLAIIRGGLPEPELNHVVWGPGGAPELWPDAAYPRYRVALQYDGVHHGEPGQHLHDISRARVTDRLGWLEVRVSKEDLLGERPAVVGRVRRALLSRGWTPR